MSISLVPGALHDFTKNYDASFQLAGSCYFASFVILFFVPLAERKVSREADERTKDDSSNSSKENVFPPCPSTKKEYLQLESMVWGRTPYQQYFTGHEPQSQYLDLATSNISNCTALWMVTTWREHWWLRGGLTPDVSRRSWIFIEFYGLNNLHQLRPIKVGEEKETALYLKIPFDHWRLHKSLPNDDHSDIFVLSILNDFVLHHTTQVLMETSASVVLGSYKAWTDSSQSIPSDEILVQNELHRCYSAHLG